MLFVGDLGSIIRTVHAKLLKASPKIVHEKILSLELKALEEQLKEAKSEQVCLLFISQKLYILNLFRLLGTFLFYVAIIISRITEIIAI